jgi:hypothetical protein
MGRTTKEDYEEKLREVEEVCGPIMKHVGRQGWGAAQDGRATRRGIGARRGAGLASDERRIDKRAKVSSGLF